MIAAFDIDGVLADFTYGFSRLAKEKFGTRLVSDDEVTDWHWDQTMLGLTKEQSNMLWADIFKSKTFWYDLPMLIFEDEVRRISDLTSRAPLFFVTNRSGDPGEVYFQSYFWIREILFAKYYADGMWSLAVTKSKGAFSEAVGLTSIIDDKLTNLIDVVKRSTTRAFLLGKKHNRHLRNEFPAYFEDEITIVNSVSEYLDIVEAEK